MSAELSSARKTSAPMTSAHIAPLAQRRVRAPGESGEALVFPPLDEVESLLAENRRRLTEASAFGSAITALRTTARHDLVQAALHYTRQYRDIATIPAEPETPLLLAGHQPQLFHAGVWFKNFVLSSLAKRRQAVGVNLIVDNDTIRTAAIRVPTGTSDAPRIENIAIDAPSEEIPFEERAIQDQALFRTFADRVATTIEPWIAEPLLAELWPLAIEALRRTSRLGEALANARHGLEGRWGLATLEVPLSTVYRQTAFRQFALLLWNDLARLRDVYNSSLREYRRVNRIRSRSHPVPDLAEEDAWQETPFWIWTTEQPRRQRLFVRSTTDSLELTDRGRVRETLPRNPHDALEAWAALERRGVKVRPRALTTTMFARLVASDLFLHGIGGAKYDELTDAIARRFFGIEPPEYLTVTATLQLPLHYERATRDELLSLQQQQRAIRFHPERFRLEGQACELVARKAELLRAIPPRGEKRAWHRELIAVNESLQPFAKSRQLQLESQLAEKQEQHRRTRLLGSREFSFGLFPAHFLRGLLLDLSAHKP